MKKFLLSGLLICLTYLSIAQTKIGLTVSPILSSTRVKYEPDTITKDKSIVLFKFGLEVDTQLADNYAFSTGLLYAPKRLRLKVNGNSSSFTQEYKAQYLQLPATLKLFTNEIQPDLKLYFQLGFMAEIKLFSEPLNIDKEDAVIDKLKFYDISFVGGIGVEYGAGINSILYAGFFYERGLINVVQSTRDNVTEDLQARMTLGSLKLGLKF